jgi:hypothetical protein
MLKPILGFAALGFGAFLVVKLAFGVLPLVGLLVGLLVLGLKVMLIVGLVYVVYRLVQKAMKPRLQVE